MKRIESQCVGCPPEMGCLYQSCPNFEVDVYICDKCGQEIDEDVYIIENKDLCEYCFDEYIREIFDGLDNLEKVNILDIDCKCIRR